MLSLLCLNISFWSYMQYIPHLSHNAEFQKMDGKVNKLLTDSN